MFFVIWSTRHREYILKISTSSITWSRSHVGQKTLSDQCETPKMWSATQSEFDLMEDVVGQVSNQSGVVSKRGGMTFFFPAKKFHEIFTKDATTNAECFGDNYDVIGHIVWQPCWKKGKTLDLCIFKTAQWKKKLETWQVKYSAWEKSVIFFWWCHKWLRFDVIIAHVKRFILSVWKMLRVISG